MKKFSIKILVITLIVLAINFVFYKSLTIDLVFQKYIYNSKSIENYNVFLLSDSHGEALKNLPSEIGIFNFSYTGDNYQDMYYKMCYLGETLNNKETILITVNNHTLSGYRDVSSNTARNYIYTTGDELLYKNEKHPIIPSKLLRKLPLFNAAYGNFYFNYLKNRKKKNLFDALNFNDLTDLEKKKAVDNRYLQQFNGQNKSEKNLFYLKRILELCHEKQINVYGVKYPVTAIYNETIKGSNMGAEKELKSRNISVINLQELNLTDDLFKDQDHLNEIGAKKMLKELKLILNGMKP